MSLHATAQRNLKHTAGASVGMDWHRAGKRISRICATREQGCYPEFGSCMKEEENSWQKILDSVTGLNDKFPEGKDPFKIMTCLLEECGELATEVNHAENIGLKTEKHGESDKEKITRETKNVIWNVFRLIKYYDLEPELEKSFLESYTKLKSSGYIL